MPLSGQSRHTAVTLIRLPTNIVLANVIRKAGPALQIGTLIPGRCPVIRHNSSFGRKLEPKVMLEGFLGNRARVLTTNRLFGTAGRGSYIPEAIARPTTKALAIQKMWRAPVYSMLVGKLPNGQAECHAVPHLICV